MTSVIDRVWFNLLKITCKAINFQNYPLPFLKQSSTPQLAQLPSGGRREADKTDKEVAAGFATAAELHAGVTPFNLTTRCSLVSSASILKEVDDLNRKSM